MPVRKRKAQPRAPRLAARDAVRAVLNRPTFADMAPASVYHELLDEGVHLCSPSTMYRFLHAYHEVKERRRQAVHPARVKPELCCHQAEPMLVVLCRGRRYADGLGGAWVWGCAGLVSRIITTSYLVRNAPRSGIRNSSPPLCPCGSWNASATASFVTVRLPSMMCDRGRSPTEHRRI